MKLRMRIFPCFARCVDFGLWFASALLLCAAEKPMMTEKIRGK